MKELGSDQFVNRRGRKPSTNELVSVPTRSQQATTKSRPNASADFFRHLKRILTPARRRKFLFVGGVVAIILIVILIVTADSVKRDYDRQTMAMRRNVTELSKLSPNPGESTSAQLSNLAASLTAKISCRPSAIDVASWYGPAKGAREACQLTAKEYTQLKTALVSAHEYAVYVEAVHEALRPALAQPSESQFAIPQDYQETWSKTNESIIQLHPPKNFEDAHGTLVDRIGAIVAAWLALTSANANQQATAFTEAEKSLQQAYVELRETSALFQSEITRTQAEILYIVQRLTL